MKPTTLDRRAKLWRMSTTWPASSFVFTLVTDLVILGYVPDWHWILSGFYIVLFFVCYQAYRTTVIAQELIEAERRLADDLITISRYREDA